MRPRLARAAAIEAALVVLLLAAQALLDTRAIHSATNYDEGVYLAATDAVRHGQALGSDVFAAQFPGFYDLLRIVSVFGIDSLTGFRAAMVAVTMLGTIGAWLVGRRFGGAFGGLAAAALLVVAPPLDLFGFQVIADMPAIALTILALGVATLPGAVAAAAAGAVFAGAVSIKLTAITAAPVLLWLVWRRLVPAVAGAAAVAVALLAVHARALDDLWASAVTYHERARSTPDVIAHPHREIFRQIPVRTPFFWIALAAASAAALRVALRRPLRPWVLWTWPPLAVAFLLWHAPLHHNHLVLFPAALAVAAGATVGALAPSRTAVYAATASEIGRAHV